MRQVFALVTEEYVQYALVDDDSGELTQFAQIKTPMQFGLAEAAVLGSNLIEALGLNSTRRGRPPKAKPFPETQADADAAVAAKHKSDPVAEVKAIEKRRRGRGQERRPENVGKPQITLDQVVAIVNQHPEGMTVNDIARVINPADVDGVKRENSWTIRSVENRVTAARERQRKGVAPLPFRIQVRPASDTDVRPVRTLYPLQGEVQTGSVPEPAPEPEPEPVTEGTFPWQQSSS